MQKDALLAEVQDVLRSVPGINEFDQHSPDSVAWIGRACAVIQRWDPIKGSADMFTAKQKFRSFNMGKPFEGVQILMTLLHEVRSDLQMELGRSSVVIDAGQVFQYFEALRKLIEAARLEVFFVDPYLEAEVVSRYLRYVPDGVQIRLLGRYKMSQLLPAVEMFQQEKKRQIEVRASDALHDRYLFIDRKEAHFSGASFKDGAKQSPALISRVTDAFQATWDQYEGHWASGKVRVAEP